MWESEYERMWKIEQDRSIEIDWTKRCWDWILVIVVFISSFLFLFLNLAFFFFCLFCFCGKHPSAPFVPAAIQYYLLFVPSVQHSAFYVRRMWALQSLYWIQRPCVRGLRVVCPVRALGQLRWSWPDHETCCGSSACEARLMHCLVP